MRNNLLFTYRLFKIRFLKKKIPLTVIFNVTNRCNLRCRHCYASYFERGNANEMSLGQVKRLLRDLKKSGCLRVSFSGGEPLVRSDINKIIRYAKGLGLMVTIDTNGTLLPDNFEAVRGADNIAVSLDGRKSHHDIIRGKGNWEKTVKGIKMAIDNHIPVNVNMVINRYNLGDVDYMIDLAKKTGFRLEFALAISNIFRDSDNNLKPSNQQFRQVIKKIIKEKKNGAPILFSSRAYESVLNSWADFKVERVEDKPKPKGMPNCPAGRVFGLIDADGCLWACPHLTGKIKAGNALEIGVAKAWKMANNHPCVGCYQVYHHEFGLLADFNLKVVWNYFKLALGLS